MFESVEKCPWSRAWNVLRGFEIDFEDDLNGFETTRVSFGRCLKYCFENLGGGVWIGDALISLPLKSF